MEFLIENWMVWVGLVILLVLAVFLIVTQKAKVQSWLLYAVTEAETYFGSSTGQLKLVWVYDLFVERFPWISAFLPYSIFSDMVDAALVTMKEMLEKNTAIATIVSGA